MNLTNTLLIFVDEMRESFAVQRILTFFNKKKKKKKKNKKKKKKKKKKNGVFVYVVSIYLTNLVLMMMLS